MVSTDGPTVTKPSTQEVKQERLRRRAEARQNTSAQRQKIDRALIEFQPDAVELEKRSVPGGARWTLYTVIALMIAAVLWACWAEVDQIVSCTGRLRTIEEPISIQTASTLPVHSINVNFGDLVRSGQVIATLDATYSEADLRQLHSNIQTVQAEIARLSAEHNGEPFQADPTRDNYAAMALQVPVFQERAREYDAKIKEFESERRKLRVQKENTIAEAEQLLVRFAALEELEAQFRKLAERGHKSPIDVLGRELQTDEAEGNLEKVKSRGRELDAEAEALDRREAAYVASWRAKLAADLINAIREEQKLTEEQAKAVRSNELSSVIVPHHEKYSEFVVLEIADNTVGSVAQPGEPLFKLVPVDATLEAEVEIPGRDIARIRAGDDVRVKVNTFPFQRHGTLTGTVRTISYGTLEKSSPDGVDRPETDTFRARVQLVEPIALEQVPDDFELLPGMAVQTEIKVGRRKVIEYFLYPLIRTLDSSIREP